jgi:glutathione synthase/RimK-type ligase-like ATP-grasp enzyme
MGGRIVLVTATELPVEDVELPVLQAAAARAGLTAEVAAWDDPAVRWDSYDLALIRSAWNYFDRVADFRSWADATSGQTRLVNSATILRWNSDKAYLAELIAAGVPTVPTSYLPPGLVVVHLPEFDDFVVKPSVGGGARNAGRFRAHQRDAALAHVADLHAAGFTAMVQPYQARVDVDGERSLLYFGGEFSHAIVKGAVLDAVTGRSAGEAHPNPLPYVPTEAEHAVALAALAAAPEEPVYARMDLVLGTDGEPVVMEAELIEPHLFLDTSTGSDDRLIAAVTKLL